MLTAAPRPFPYTDDLAFSLVAESFDRAVDLFDGDKREDAIYVLEQSLLVIKPHHFFNWTQGALQALVPHDVLICGVRPDGKLPMRFFRYSATRYFTDAHFAQVCTPNEGMLPQMIARWQSRPEPCLVAVDETFNNWDPNWLPLLQQSELQNLAAHGVAEGEGRARSYFCFARVRAAMDAHLARMLTLVAPLLDVTFSRVLSHERGMAPEMSKHCKDITVREVEVLQMLCYGKTNREIALAMGLSPCTIKNHLQKIFRKLNVKSRAYAGARAVALGIVKSE